MKTILLGSGGHGRVALDCASQMGMLIEGVCSPSKPSWRHDLVPYLGGDEVLEGYSSQDTLLLNGLGGVGRTEPRRDLYLGFKAKGFSFASLLHPSAVLAKDVSLEEGVQVFAGCVVQVGVSIGVNSILNTRSVLDHGCRIGAHVHIATGAVLSGDVSVGDGAHIGAGAVVIQGIEIGKGALVAAGAVVVRDVPPGEMVMGVPARIKKRMV